MAELNLWAVGIAAFANFILGGLWYAPGMFGVIWNRENGLQLRPGHPAVAYGLSLIFFLVAAVLFAHHTGPKPDLAEAVQLGLIVGAGFVATSFGINYQFAGRSIKLWMIDGGFHIAQFVVLAIILGIWP